MSVLTDVCKVLSTAGVGSTGSAATWPIYFREFSQRSTTDNQIVIVPTGGYAPWDAEGSTHVTRPTFQVVVRTSATASTGLEAKVDGVIAALELYKGTPNQHRWLDCELQGEPAYLGRDGNNRPMYSVNFVGYRSRTT